MKKKVDSYQITLVPEDERGYTVLVPSLPGCVSYGRTVDEVADMAKEAIAHLENLRAHGPSFPDEDSRPVHYNSERRSPACLNFRF
jgi:antitoxin HicB